MRAANLRGTLATPPGMRGARVKSEKRHRLNLSLHGYHRPLFCRCPFSDLTSAPKHS
jgi:hypothetical protein